MPLYVNVDMENGEIVNTWIDALQASFSGVQVRFPIGKSLDHRFDSIGQYPSDSLDCFSKKILMISQFGSHCTYIMDYSIPLSRSFLSFLSTSSCPVSLLKAGHFNTP